MLADRVEVEVFAPSADGPAARLVVDGQEIPLTGYPTKAIVGILEGFVSSLSGAPESLSTIEVTVRTKRG